MHKLVFLVLFSLLAVAFSAPTDVVVKEKKASSSSSESKEKDGTSSSLAEGLKKKTADSSEELAKAEGAVKVGVDEKAATPLQPLAATAAPITSTTQTIQSSLGGTK